MYRSHRIAVVVPAYNEARQLPGVLDTIPHFVDETIVVDDGSSDETHSIAQKAARLDPRIRVIRRASCGGVGAAIACGYGSALEADADIVAIMAGDGQMDPADLPALIDPIVRGETDFAKGNRLAHPDRQSTMPATRYFGTLILSYATRIITRYPRLMDSQCGYTAIHRRALRAIDFENLYRGYGQPIDLLARLSNAGMRSADVTVRPLYGVGEVSRMRIHRVVIPILCLLARLALRSLRPRIVMK